MICTGAKFNTNGCWSRPIMLATRACPGAQSSPFILLGFLLHQFVEPFPPYSVAIGNTLWKPNHRPIRYRHGSERLIIAFDLKLHVPASELPYRQLESHVVYSHTYPSCRVATVSGRVVEIPNHSLPVVCPIRPDSFQALPRLVGSTRLRLMQPPRTAC